MKIRAGTLSERQDDMKNFKLLIGIIFLGYSLQGCGESYIGTYTTDNTKFLTSGSSCGVFGKNSYHLEARVSIDGDSMTLQIVDVRPLTGNTFDEANRQFSGKTIDATLENNIKFYVDEQAFSNTDKVTLSADGVIDETRENITGLVVTLRGEFERTDTGKTCTGEFTIRANKMSLVH